MFYLYDSENNPTFLDYIQRFKHNFVKNARIYIKTKNIFHFVLMEEKINKLLNQVIKGISPFRN